MKLSSIKIIILISIVLLAFFAQEYPKVVKFHSDSSYIYFFDIGQGDASLIKTNDKRLVLIDGGPNSSVLYEISEVLPFWINKIDIVVVTHSHADHITGLVDVLKRYQVDCLVYIDKDSSISNVEGELRNVILEEGINKVDDISQCSNGKDFTQYTITSNQIENQIIDLKDTAETSKLDFGSYDENENLESLIMLYSVEDFDVLFTGDAEIPVQEAAINSISKDIEVIKIPHHGSRDSFYPSLIEKLKPELGVISVGANNKFGHPNTEVTEGYPNFGVKLFRTDLDGIVGVKTNGHNWEVVK